MQHVTIELPDYIRSTLRQDRLQAILSHLETCTLCREEERKLRVVFAELEQEHLAPPPPEYFTTLLPRLRGRQLWHSDSSSLWLALVTKLAIPVALALVAIFGLVRLSTDSDSSLRASLNPNDVIEALADGDGQGIFMTLSQDVSGMLLDRTLANLLTQDLLANGSISPFGAEVLLMELSENDVEIVLQQLSERKIL